MIIGHDEAGHTIGMNYAVAIITGALDSVSQICDTGATVIFTRTGGTIVRANGDKSTFERTGDTYTRRVRVPKLIPFHRQSFQTS